MATIDSLVSALDELEIVRRVSRRHDEARMRFQLESNTVADYDGFSAAICNYYSHHFAYVTNGLALEPAEAAGRAKEILDRETRRKHSDIVGIFNDAHEGTNGGLRVVLDTIAEALKAEFVERYIRDVFDRHVAPNDWDTKVEIIRQFLSRYAGVLGSSVKQDTPERYAHNYQELIRAYVESLRQASSMFRRL